ncbi:hypothetical protein acdb102_13680 [Acidothermaceae bacterium B102]|nr:hypothetical protein acdb102_13680 [Acidothermaceae bacterium B102]
MTEERDMPITDELREMVGNPYPSTDLAVRARRRGAELRRRRLAATTSAAVAVGVLAVPAFLVVGGQSGTILGSPGAGGAGTTTAAARPSSVPGKAGVPLVLSKSTELSAVDHKRVAAAKGLLGTRFTEIDAGVLLDTQTGKAVGTSATFRATDGGGSVGIAWNDVQLGTAIAVSGSAGPGANVPAIKASAVAEAQASTDAAKNVVAASGSPAAPASLTVVGTVASDGKIVVSLKIVQGAAGSPPILSGAAGPAFAQQLLTLSE